jgi:hypothetical protein
MAGTMSEFQTLRVMLNDPRSGIREDDVTGSGDKEIDRDIAGFGQVEFGRGGSVAGAPLEFPQTAHARWRCSGTELAARRSPAVRLLGACPR